MYKIIITEVIIYVIGCVLCCVSLYSTDWFNVSLKKSINNITGFSFGLSRGCESFVNGTSSCSSYYDDCSNSPFADFCVDMIICRMWITISAMMFIIILIMSLFRSILIMYNINKLSEGMRNYACLFCMINLIGTVIISLFGILALIGTAIGVGYGADAMQELLQIFHNLSLVTFTFGSGYRMIIVSIICASMCLIIQYGFCYKRWSPNNQPHIIYQYLPPQTELHHINPLIQDNINTQPPPIYSSKA